MKSIGVQGLVCILMKCGKCSAISELFLLNSLQLLGNFACFLSSDFFHN